MVDLVIRHPVLLRRVLTAWRHETVCVRNVKEAPGDVARDATADVARDVKIESRDGVAKDASDVAMTAWRLRIVVVIIWTQSVIIIVIIFFQLLFSLAIIRLFVTNMQWH